MTVDELKAFMPGKRRKPSKFYAKRTVVDGVKFDSQKEAARWQELQAMERAGMIRNLRRQVRYPLVMTTEYRADHVYEDVGTDETVVEDVKGFRTREYLRKRKLMQQQYGITIREV